MNIHKSKQEPLMVPIKLPPISVILTLAYLPTVPFLAGRPAISDIN